MKTTDALQLTAYEFEVISLLERIAKAVEVLGEDIREDIEDVTKGRTPIPDLRVRR